MSLAKIAATQTFYSFLQQMQMFIFGTIINIIVINILPREEYGLIGLAAGYYVILTWFAISPANILSQRYQGLREQYGDYLSKIYTFTYLTIISLLIIGVALSIVVFNVTHSYYATIIFLAYSATQLVMLLSNLAQYLLKLEFKQQIITRLTGVIRSSEILLLLLLFLFPHAYVVIAVTMLVAITETILFTKQLNKLEPFQKIAPIRPTLNTIWEHIKSYSLWHHLGTNLIRYMYEIDTVFLGLWASLTVVGNYSIAMKIANFTFIIPSLLQSNASILFTRLESVEKQNRALSLLLKYSAIISLLQLGLFLLFGKLYIGLHTKSDLDVINIYAVLIVIGTTVLNTARPLISYINAYSSMRSFFLYSVLPAAIFTSIVYPISAYRYGAIGLSVGNIMCYAFWLLTMIVYMRRTPFRFSLILLDHEEKQLLSKFINRIRKNHGPVS